MHLIVHKIRKRIGSHSVLQGVDLDVPAGGLTVLLGPEGSGKSTLLRVLAGIDRADYGEIFLHGEKARDLPVRDRKIGYIFDKPCFFNHLNMYQNLRLVLRKQQKNQEDENAVRQIAEELRFAHLLMALPTELTRFQLFTAQLARALLNEPTLVLIDDPFAQVNGADFNQLRLLLKNQITHKGRTMLVATRFADQAQLLANRLAVIDSGIIQQIDTPENMYRSPKNLSVANSIYTQGFNIIPARIKKRLKTAINCVLCELAEVQVRVNQEKLIGYDYDAVFICLPANRFAFVMDEKKNQALPARLLEVESTEGKICSHWYVDQDTQLEVHSDKPPSTPTGTMANIYFAKNDAFVYSKSSQLLGN